MDLEKDFLLPNTLSAMAKTFFVKAPKTLKQDNWYLKPGSMVTGVKILVQSQWHGICHKRRRNLC